MKRIIISIISIVIFLSCNSNRIENNKISLIKKDVYIVNEKDLLYLKNHLFIIYLNRLEFDSNLKYGISKKDSCYSKMHIQDVSTHQYLNTSRYNLNYIYEDKNSKNLINKWLSKDDFDLIPVEDGDKIKHSFNYYKALEFYNSDDLRNYIDSVRTVEYKK